MTEKKSSEVGSKKKAVGIGVAVILAVAAGIGIGIFMSGRDSGEQKQAGYTITEDNYQQIKEDMSAEVAEGYFETYMNTEWTFEDGTAETKDAIFGNSPNNTKPIRMEVILDDTGEIVYSSDVLPVGAKLSAFALDKDLDAGVYEALCQVYLMDEAADGSFVDFSSAGFYITLTVEN